MEATAQQLPNRKTERFALDVPKRDVDTTHGMDSHASAAAVNVASVHLVPDLLRLERIFTNDQAGESRRCGVRERAVDDALGAERVRIHLADAGDSRIRMNLDDE